MLEDLSGFATVQSYQIELEPNQWESGLLDDWIKSKPQSKSKLLKTTVPSKPQPDRTSKREEILSGLFRDYKDTMISYATRLLAGDVASAEDAVFEAYADIWRKSESLDDKAYYQAWLRRIVRNKAVDLIRKKGGRETALPEDFDQIWVDDSPSPEEQLIDKRQNDWLRSGLTELNLAQREVVLLCYFEGKSIAEIADIMQCPANTVKTRLHYAREKLGKWMKKSGFTPEF